MSSVKTKTMTLLAGAALAFSGTLISAAPAQAYDRFPNAPICTVDSDHVTVRQGSRGNSVREVQCFLNRRGEGLAVDGVFGSRTDAAVRDFQRSRGLVADGIVGPRTWEKLFLADRPIPCSGGVQCPV